jgi:hypothetical protein
MIHEFKAYHGSAFLELIDDSTTPISVLRPDLNKNSLYELNGEIGLYLKHSVKRVSPWRFTFQPEHVEDLSLMKEKYNHNFLILICGRNSIAVINSDEFSTLLPVDEALQSWISVRTGHNRMLQIEGSSGSLSRKIRRTNPYIDLKALLSN